MTKTFKAEGNKMRRSEVEKIGWPPILSASRPFAVRLEPKAARRHCHAPWLAASSAALFK